MLNISGVHSKEAIMSTQYYPILTTAKQAFASGLTKNIQFRRSQLKQLYKLLQENEHQFVEALKADLMKSRFESIMTEVDFVLNDIRSALNNLDSWVKPEYVSKCFVTLVDDNYIHYEPYGVVLVLSAWNYPVQLAFSPLVGAIAAGNACIIKTSEVAPATASLINKLIPMYMNNEAFHCIMGDGRCAQILVASPLIDYIFFTGSTHIGRIIYETASRNLTPCTLEMGGKSPVFIDELTYQYNGRLNESLFETTVRRILWGKFLNTGQTCVAPDYILCSEFILANFLRLAPKILEKFYGKDPLNNSDYGRIVNARNYQRLVDMLTAQGLVNHDRSKDGHKMIGGGFQIDSNNNHYIEPTIVVCSNFNDPVMRSEIFGPILPIVIVSNEDEAIALINSRDKPLSLYIFSKRDSLIKKFQHETSSGSICVNDTVLHLVAEALPFGGVGKSGIGAYHGKHSFKTFSHQKSVLVRGFNPIIEWVAKKRYPPYSENHLVRMLRLLKRRKNPVSFVSTSDIYALFMFMLGVLVCYLRMIQ